MTVAFGLEQVSKVINQHIVCRLGHNSMGLLGKLLRDLICLECFPIFPGKSSAFYPVAEPRRTVVANLLFLSPTRKWRTSWKRCSESSSHSGTASSSKTAESPDWKSRWPRWPCERTRRPGPSSQKKKEEEKGKQNVGFISLGVVLAVRPGQHSKINFLFLVPHQISLFVLTQKGKKKKSPEAH